MNASSKFRSHVLLVLLCVARVTSAADQPLTGAFAINLSSTQEMPATLDVAYLDGKQLYIANIPVGGTEWKHLRIGFYSSEGRAESERTDLREWYPDASVVRVSPAEFQIAAENPVKRQVTSLPQQPSATQAATGLSSDRLGELMAEGRTAILVADYTAAIRSYTRVLQEGETSYAPDALEYLGVARERNGQQAHAVAEYRRYLATYPQADGAARVRQRLDGLLVTTTQSSSGIDPQPAGTRSQQRWNIYGGVSQYYRQDEADFGGQGSQTIQQAVLTDIDVLTRRAGERFDIETRMTMGHYYDLLSDTEGPGSDSRVYYLYADVTDQELGLSARAGRQRLYTSGVLGRFDGAHVAWQFSPDWRVNVVAGEPVYSTSRSDDLDRSFYALSVDAFDVADMFDINVYYNTQEVDGIDDREAIGAELRYYSGRYMLVSYFDYDVGYNELNSFVALGNWTLDNDVTLNASFDQRRTPYLLTENALVGQGVDTIDELRENFTEDEIRQLAEQNTGELTTVTVGAAKPINERWQVNADVTASDFSSDQINIGSTNQYYYNLNFVASSLLKEGDSSLIGFRYIDGDTTQTTSISLDTRYPVGERFRINPRIVLSQRDLSAADATEVLIVPSLRLFYRFRKRTRFELEFGGRWSDQEFGSESIKSDSWFTYLGYRTDF
jgi:hypothetical protein